jgi:hypothetical protein
MQGSSKRIDRFNPALRAHENPARLISTFERIAGGSAEGRALSGGYG